ncbi:hypothetical protein B0H13DRAFT_1879174 [Mycena leptocephala]|nr:hypothetical protein B0H13DRAFT_1879174 [Mycena leptocephala]
MSISIDGVLCATVGQGLTLVNTVSSRFFAAHFSGRDPLVPFQITLSTAARGTFTTSLAFSVDPLLPVDVALGLRWKAYVREWLLASGALVPSSFDPWAVFLGNASPLAFLGPVGTPLLVQSGASPISFAPFSSPYSGGFYLDGITSAGACPSCHPC